MTPGIRSQATPHPKSQMPSQEADRAPLIRALNRLQSTFWRRRLLHWTVRAMWLALLVPTIVMAGYLWFGWQVPWDIWVVTMLLVGFLSMLWSLRPISIKQMTRRLDNLLGMRSQLVTALEVSYDNRSPAYAKNLVAEHLIQDAVNTTVHLRRQVRLLGRGFWLEANMLIAVAALLGAMLLLDALTPRFPNATLVDLPPLGQEPQADEVIPPDPVLPPPFQPPPQQATPEQVQAALEALADALRDQAASRPVADALDRGEAGQAAEEMRRLADQLGELSESAQRELGQSMQEAADNIGQSVPDLSQPLEQGNDALEQGNLPGATQALEDLAEALDEIDGSQSNADAEAEGEGEPQDAPGESQEEGGGDQESGEGDGAGEGEEGGEGNQPPGEEEERLPIDGEPLELESEFDLEDRVLQPSELDAEAEDQTSDSPFARQPLNAPGEDLGPDPLAYPWQKREIIRDYFTP